MLYFLSKICTIDPYIYKQTKIRKKKERSSNYQKLDT